MEPGDGKVKAKPDEGQEPEDVSKTGDESGAEAVDGESSDQPKEKKPRRWMPWRMPGTISGKILAALVVCFCIAALTLWTAPRLARVLPSGLQPVAVLLSPGQSEAITRIEALEQEIRDRLGSFDDRLAMVEAATEELVSDAELASMLSGYDEFVDSRLEDVMEAMPDEPGADLSGQLDALEARLEQVESDQAAVRSQALDTGDGVEPVAVAPDIADRIREQQVALADLENALATLGASQDEARTLIAELAGRLDELASVVAESRGGFGRIDPAQRRLVDDIAKALATGDAFPHSMNALSRLPDVDVPAALSDIAVTGTPPLPELRRQFPEVAYGAVRASVLAETGDGWVDRSIGFLRSLVVSRSLEPREGSDVDAVLSRVEAHLEAGRLKAVLDESGGLPEAAAVSMADWLADVRRLDAALDALDEIAGSPLAMSGN